MSTRIFVKAAEGREFVNNHVVLGHPVDGPLREEGSWWLEDNYTFRLMRDGDIVQVEGMEPMAGPSIGPEALMYSPARGKARK